jgi:hypothetical protein
MKSLNSLLILVQVSDGISDTQGVCTLVAHPLAALSMACDGRALQFAFDLTSQPFEFNDPLECHLPITGVIAILA